MDSPWDEQAGSSRKGMESPKEPRGQRSSQHPVSSSELTDEVEGGVRMRPLVVRPSMPQGIERVRRRDLDDHPTFNVHDACDLV